MSSTPPSSDQPAGEPAAEIADALRQREEQAAEIVQFVDRTSFAGDEEAAAGEITTTDQHPADTADITFQREIDLTVRQMAARQLEEIAAARERQREGTYGLCTVCGRPIDPERLRVRPEAATCIDCQRTLEQAAQRGER